MLPVNASRVEQSTVPEALPLTVALATSESALLGEAQSSSVPVQVTVFEDAELVTPCANVPCRCPSQTRSRLTVRAFADQPVLIHAAETPTTATAVAAAPIRERPLNGLM